MKKMFVLVVLSMMLVVMTACTPEEQFECGEGTVLEGESCVPIVDDEEPVDEPNEDAVTCGEGTELVGTVCEAIVNENPVGNNDTCDGPHEVVNGDFVNPPAEPWFFIGGWMVSQPDSIWMEQFDAIIFDVTDAAFPGRNVWDGAFWQPKVYTEAGCTYTVSYTLRTDEAAGREVIVFLEDTDNNYFKFIEETVTLTQEYQTFTYTYVASTTNNDTKIGIFFANDVGTVIIDSILVENVPAE